MDRIDEWVQDEGRIVSTINELNEIITIDFATPSPHHYRSLTNG